MGDKESSELRSAIEELTLLARLKPNNNDDDHRNPCEAKIPTMPFLSICNSVLQVLGL